MACTQNRITFHQLLEEQATFKVSSSEIGYLEDIFAEEDDADLLAQLEGLGMIDDLIDEDVYIQTQSFSQLEKQMENVTADGKIKKKILRQGTLNTESPKLYSTVRIHYDAYMEHEEKPFDSSYGRKPLIFVVGDGKVLPGLDIAVQSMKESEKSQFLVHSDYAYGSNCLIGKVPPNTTILFEIQLLEIIDTATIVRFEKLPEAEKSQFSEVHKYCLALKEKGKKHFETRSFNLSLAIKDYNLAVTALEKIEVEDPKELREKRELLLKLYSNLLVCHTRSNNWRKGCAQATKIFDLIDSCQYLNASPKIYFNYAKCLRMLNEYKNAQLYLNKAYKMEPHNLEIANEMVCLEKDISDQRDKEKAIVTAFLKK